MGNTALLEPVRKFHYKKGETPVPKGDLWWLRKKVPQRYRVMVGRKEIWRSLDTTDRKEACTRCAQLSAELEAEWKHREAALRDVDLREAAKRPVVPEARLSALQREVHERTRDTHLDNPGWHLRWAAATGALDAYREDEEREFAEQAMEEFLALVGEEFNQADRDRFLPLFAEARRRGYHDLMRAAKERDFSPSPLLDKYAPKAPKKIEFKAAFEFYCANGEIKGGTTGPTAKRWRPKIAAFCKFVGYDDLARVTTEDGYRWADDLKARGVAPKSVRDVWIAVPQGHRRLHGGAQQARQEPLCRDPHPRRQGNQRFEQQGLLGRAGGGDPDGDAGHTFRPHDAGDPRRAAVGSMGLRLFGRAGDRDHFASAGRYSPGP